MLFELLLFLFMIKEDKDIQKIDREIQRIKERLDDITIHRYHYNDEGLEDLV